MEYSSPLSTIRMNSGCTRCDQTESSCRCRVDKNSLCVEFQTEYWWQGTNSQVETSKTDPSCNLKSLWLDSISGNECFSPRVDVTEYQVMRECLWILLGSERAFLFSVATDTSGLLAKNYCTCTRIASVTHLTFAALDAYLTEVARCATCCLRIHAFINFVTLKNRDRKVPSCFLTLAENLRDRLLNDFRAFLSQLEKRVRLGQVRTLISLLGDLNIWFQRFDILCSLLIQITSSQLATLFYDPIVAMYVDKLELLVQMNTSCFMDQYLVQFIGHLFLATIESYFSPLFDFFRNVANTTKFSLPDQFAHLGSVTQVKSNATITVPRIFRSIWPELSTSLKAVSLLRELAVNLSNNRLLEDLNRIPIPKLNYLLSEHKLYSSPKPSKLSPVIDCPLFSIIDPELQKLFSSLQISHSSFFSMYQAKENLGIEGRLEDYQLSSVTRQRHLVTIVREYCDSVSHLLIKHLLFGPLYPDKPGYNLGSLLSILGAVYLFSAGDSMNDFCRRVFQLRASTGSLCSHEVENVFRTSLHTQNGFSCRTDWRLFLPYLHPEVFGETAEDAELTLKMTVDWPLNVVVSEDALQSYTNIFHFVLKIKNAKWGLDCLCYPRQYQREIPHELIILRARLVFVINGINSFFLDHIEAARYAFFTKLNIEPSPGLKSSLSSVFHKTRMPRSLEQLVKYHSDFVGFLKSLCLLDSPDHECLQSFLHKAIIGLLGVARKVIVVWSKHEAHSAHTFSELAQDFTSHVSLIDSLVSRIIVAGYSSSQSLLHLQHIFATASIFNSNTDTRLH